MKNFFMSEEIDSAVSRDLQYISIWQYIDTLIEYRIVILCSINIEIIKMSYSTEWCTSYVVNVTFLCV